MIVYIPCIFGLLFSAWPIYKYNMHIDNLTEQVTSAKLEVSNRLLQAQQEILEANEVELQNLRELLECLNVAHTVVHQ